LRETEVIAPSAHLQILTDLYMVAGTEV
jgi:hypothetical protein